VRCSTKGTKGKRPSFPGVSHSEGTIREKNFSKHTLKLKGGGAARDENGNFCLPEPMGGRGAKDRERKKLLILNPLL